MVLLIYSRLLLITGVQIKAFNEASDEVLTSWIPPGAWGNRRRLAGALPVYSYSPVMKCLYAAAWSPGRKNRLKMMSSSKSFLALSFHLMPGALLSHSPRSPKKPRIYLAGWTDAIFMTLLLFYHGNSFESIYQSAAAIRHVALKDQVQVIPSLHSGALRWKGRSGGGGGRKETPPTPPTLSTA